MKTKMIFTSGNSSLLHLFTLYFRSYAVASNIHNDYEFDSVARLEKLIHTRCKSGNLRLDEALGYFNSLIRTRPLPSIWVFNHLLGTLSNKTCCSLVISMYKQMMGCVHFRPDVCTMTIVIKCLCLMKKVHLGFSVLATFCKYGLQPNAYTLNTLLDGFCVKGFMVAANELFLAIVGKKHPCDDITYLTIINGFCKAKETEKALKLLKKMYDDKRVIHSVGCFNPIIDSLCKEGQMHEALILFHDMIKLGVLPNCITYSSLIHSFCGFGRWEEAKRFLFDMINAGISPDVCTYSALVDSLCKENKTQEAESLFGLMTKKGIRRNVVTFNSLISVWCKSGRWVEVTQLLEYMMDDGISADIVTYSTMLDSLFKEGRTKETLDLMEVMTTRDLKPTVVTYNSLIYGLCRSGQWRDVTKLLDKMQDEAILPDVITFNI